MSGGELIVKIREKYKSLPIIVITGHGGEFSSKAAEQAGVDGYFQKPFSNLELVRKMRAILNQSAALINQ
jgi:DNA-binding response OmpR family regulator